MKKKLFTIGGVFAAAFCLFSVTRFVHLHFDPVKPGLRLIHLWFIAVAVSGTLPLLPARGVEPAKWECVTDRLYAELKSATIAKDGKTEAPHARRTQGIMVDPTTGVVVLSVHKNGLYSSTDHGSTWTPFGMAPLSGRGESGAPFNAVLPFTGRFAAVTIDGTSAHTLDNGKTWITWTKHRRGFDAADLDWASESPQTIFALNHEPYYRCLSTDGGKTWKDLEETPYPNKDGNRFRLGVLDAKTILSSQRAEKGMSLSTDEGKTWTRVADFVPLGMSPVHYGKKLYWAAEDGVYRTEDGRAWNRIGSLLPNATWGPYFGKNENDMMVVTDKGFFLTADCGMTWKNVAAYFAVPDIASKTNKGGYDPVTTGRYFAWDHVGGYLYAGGMGGSMYRLRLTK